MITLVERENTKKTWKKEINGQKVDIKNVYTCLRLYGEYITLREIYSELDILPKEFYDAEIIINGDSDDNVSRVIFKKTEVFYIYDELLKDPEYKYEIILYSV